MRQQIAADHDVDAFLGGARVRLDAGDAMANVGCVRRLAHLAVADHVDAGCNLLGDDIVGCLHDLGIERLRRDGLALFAAQD